MAVKLQPIFVFFGLFFLVFVKANPENYGCPAGWDFGSVCGNNNCYRIVSIPPANRARSIDDNFCAQFDKDAMPASIRCKEENDFIPTLPRNKHLIDTTGLGIGAYIPAHVPWSPRNFINRDGSKLEYTNWGYVGSTLAGAREPAPGGEKATLYFIFKSPRGIDYTWHDASAVNLYHLLCKRPAILQPPKPVLPAVMTKDDGDGSYVCPAGFDLGNVCGGHFCYRVVSVPDGKRSRMIDNNFCSEFEKDAMPAIIRCKEENELIVTLSDNVEIAEKSGFALGLYIPVTKPWNPNNFINYDGSKIEYLNWGIFDSPTWPFKEPNGFLNGYPERIVSYMRIRDGDSYLHTWHDVGDTASPHLLCKTSAKLKPSMPVAMKDEFSSYSCPEGWVLGDVCGGHHCYKIVPVPDNQRARVIDDNYCGEVDKRSIPAIIRCEEENEFLSTPPFAPTAIQTGFALGLYIPANQPWSSNGFINYDGSKVEYLKWGINYSNNPPIKEPNGWMNGFIEKVVVYLMQKNGNDFHKAWHDYGHTAVRNVLCKMPAIGSGKNLNPPQFNPPKEAEIEPLPATTKQPKQQSCLV